MRNTHIVHKLYIIQKVHKLYIKQILKIIIILILNLTGKQKENEIFLFQAMSIEI